MKFSSEIRQEARRHVDGHKGDVKAAVKSFEATVRASAKLTQAMTEPLIAGACYDLCVSLMREQRQRVWTAPNYDSAEQAKRFGGYTDRLLLLDFPLRDGVLLRDAPIEAITAQIEVYESMSIDMAIKAAWLRMIATKLPEGMTAGEAFTETQVQGMRASAEQMFEEARDAAAKRPTHR